MEAAMSVEFTWNLFAKVELAGGQRTSPWSNTWLQRGLRLPLDPATFETCQHTSSCRPSKWFPSCCQSPLPRLRWFRLDSGMLISTTRTSIATSESFACCRLASFCGTNCAFLVVHTVGNEVRKACYSDGKFFCLWLLRKKLRYMSGSAGTSFFIQSMLCKN